MRNEWVKKHDWPKKSSSQALLLYMCAIELKYLTGMQGIFFTGTKQIRCGAPWLQEEAAATDVNDLDFYGLQGDRYACMSNNKVVISCSIIPSSIRPVLNGDIALSTC